MGLLIEKAMEWKAKTMGKEWKWTFAAQATVLATIAVQVATLGMILVFIIPRVIEEYSTRGATVPDYLRLVLNAATIVNIHGVYMLLLFVVAWWIFEWRCRSEHKSLIRLASGAFLSLAIAAIAGYVSVATMVGLIVLP